MAKKHQQECKLDHHQININRFDNLITSMESYVFEDDNGWNWAIEDAIKELIKAKLMYLAWIQEEY